MNMVKWSPTRYGNYNEMDRFFNDFIAPRQASNDDCVWAPQADISENDKAYELHIELVGFEKKDVEIKFEDQTLTISGERKADDDENMRYRRVERMYGKFARRFRLPKEADADEIKAELKNGLLTISIPKSEKVLGRQIEVK